MRQLFVQIPRTEKGAIADAQVGDNSSLIGENYTLIRLARRAIVKLSIDSVGCLSISSPDTDQPPSR